MQFVYGIKKPSVEFCYRPCLVKGPHCGEPHWSRDKKGKNGQMDKCTLNMFAKSDVVMLNAGHWLDLSKIGPEYAEVYKELLDFTLPQVMRMRKKRQRVFFRTTASRFFQNGDWNTTPKGTCGASAPRLNATFSDYNPLSLSVPSLNDMLLKALAPTNFEVIDSSSVAISREDATFDCSHFCLPGIPTVWNLMLMNRLCPRAIPPDPPVDLAETPAEPAAAAAAAAAASASVAALQFAESFTEAA